MSYHLRRADREITDPDELRSIIGKGNHAIIALSNNDEPYVVTLSYGYSEEEHALYFHCAKEGHKLDILRRNPRVCATIIDDDGFDGDICDYSYTSLVLRGSILLLSDVSEADRAIRLMIEQLEKCDPDRFYAKLHAGQRSYDNMQILKLRIESITGKRRVFR